MIKENREVVYERLGKLSEAISDLSRKLSFLKSIEEVINIDDTFFAEYSSKFDIQSIIDAYNDFIEVYNSEEIIAQT